jgi:glycosyltransferase involved in cell wall biosynthesis
LAQQLISVVLCTYNGIRFIEDQLVSIQKQTYKALEIIIIDDASTDGTFNWLQNQVTKDNRLQLFKNDTNQGFNFNFNKACIYTTGKFIAIADQDDIWELNKLEILFEALNKVENIMLVHCISARFEEEGKPHLQSHKIINHFSGNDGRNFLLTNQISGHNMLIKRELLDAALPFPKDGYYDWWLVLHACCLGRIEAVEKILVWHRVHDNNATGAAKPKVPFYKFTQTNLPLILSIKHMPENYKKLGKRLLEFYKQLPEKKFSYKLFFFLLRNAKIIFAHKKRAFPWLSYAKHSYRYSKASF